MVSKTGHDNPPPVPIYRCSQLETSIGGCPGEAMFHYRNVDLHDNHYWLVVFIYWECHHPN